ncbi:hypothetical protein [Paraburkholderia sp. J41]|uniref:hypothetical protein n=1 Tax=Paraburkholderia sp. J41 TaxID=2805433 RepID=UPI002AC322BA|nr:hypothetical protein [Paraburkholderia sp. J41]
MIGFWRSRETEAVMVARAGKPRRAARRTKKNRAAFAGARFDGAPPVHRFIALSLHREARGRRQKPDCGWLRLRLSL